MNLILNHFLFLFIFFLIFICIPFGINIFIERCYVKIERKWYLISRGYFAVHFSIIFLTAYTFFYYLFHIFTKIISYEFLNVSITLDYVCILAYLFIMNFFIFKMSKHFFILDSHRLRSIKLILRYQIILTVIPITLFYFSCLKDCEVMYK